VLVYAERMAAGTARLAPMLAAFFLALVAAVLLVSCANVLGCFLRHGPGTRYVAKMLGGTSWHLMRLCLVEALSSL
jgi:hypothetical protein